MNQNVPLKVVKYAALATAGLMIAGIALVMFLSRGTGEDITGVVAPALLVTILAAVAACAAIMLQRRGSTTIDATRSP